MNKLSHLDEQGKARMVDVSGKEGSARQAWAGGHLELSYQAYGQLKDGALQKGDALAVAKVAGIQAAKQTHHLIPLCHPLELDFVDVTFKWHDEQNSISWVATAKCSRTTGVEMEALTCSAVVGLTLHDMVKAVDPWCTMGDVHLLRKVGGKSGEIRRP